MSGILRLESLTKGNTLKQGDKTPLKYRLFDADGEQLNIAGKSAKARLVYPDFLTIGYEKDGLTVAQDDTVTFTIDGVIPSRIYHVEIIVDDQFIFPSRADESKFTVDKSSLGTEANVIEVVGVDQIVNTVLGRVDADISQAVTDITTTNEAIQQAEQERAQGYQEIQQIIEDGTLNAEPANGSVGIEKLSFIKHSKNLFDKTKAVIGYVNNVTGAISPNVSDNNYYASDFMPVKPNTQYTRSGLGRLAFYDSNKVFISGLIGDSNYTITTPTNTAYVRHTILSYDELETFQFEEGSSMTTYEPYKGALIDSNYVEQAPLDVSQIPDKSISKDKLDFFKNGKNLLDVTKSTKGVYVNNTSGKLSPNNDYEASDYIAVKAGDMVTISNTVLTRVRYAFYKTDLDFISGGVNQPMPLTAPEDGFIRISYDTGATPQVEIGAIATPYEPFSYVLDGVKVEGGTSTPAVSNVDVILSPKIYAVVGQEVNIYFKNIIDRKDTMLDFDVTSPLGKQMADRWTSTPIGQGTNALSVAVYKDFEQVGVGSTLVVTNAVTTKDTSVLYFGDSTVNAGGVTKRLLDLYALEASNLTLLGTRGLDANNRYEGRGGWSGATYRTPTVIYGEGNPFYNPAKSDFDFSYYMSNQGYTTPEHFVIQLGINDTFNQSYDYALNDKIDTILDDFDFIIADVKNYSNDIKVGVTITIPPNANQDAFGNAYQNNQTQWRYKRNNAIWTKRLIEHFKDKETQGIHLVPQHHNIDTTINIADGVHPKQAGYDQMGDSVYAYLKSFS